MSAKKENYLIDQQQIRYGADYKDKEVPLSAQDIEPSKPCFYPAYRTSPDKKVASIKHPETRATQINLKKHHQPSFYKVSSNSPKRKVVIQVITTPSPLHQLKRKQMAMPVVIDDRPIRTPVRLTYKS